MKHIYQVKLINLATGKKAIMPKTYTSRKAAQEIADNMITKMTQTKWNLIGYPYAAQVIQYK